MIVFRRRLQRFGRWTTIRQFTQSSSFTASTSRTRSRIDRVEGKLPRFLQVYLRPLRNAPLTHVFSFLVLHELTAVVPLVGLATTFHYSHWLPPFVDPESKVVMGGMELFGRYFRRKGWISEAEKQRVDEEIEKGTTGDREQQKGKLEKGVRVVVEVATAYAITKALLPARLLISVWATPWFARVCVVPGQGMIKRMVGR